jgi:hypothetical protein
MQSESRLAAARSRAASVKTGAAVAALATFAVAFGLFRGHHATATTDDGSSVSPAQSESASSFDDDGGFFDDGGASVAPSNAAPQVQTGAS